MQSRGNFVTKYGFVAERELQFTAASGVGKFIKATKPGEQSFKLYRTVYLPSHSFDFESLPRNDHLPAEKKVQRLGRPQIVDGKDQHASLPIAGEFFGANFDDCGDSSFGYGDTIPRCLKSCPNQIEPEYSNGHTDDRRNTHGTRPGRHGSLGGKIIFVALIWAAAFICFCAALSRRKLVRFTENEYVFPLGVFIIGGAFVGLDLALLLLM